MCPEFSFDKYHYYISVTPQISSSTNFLAALTSLAIGSLH